LFFNAKGKKKINQYQRNCYDLPRPSIIMEYLLIFISLAHSLIKTNYMKKYVKIVTFAAAVLLIAITLTSGIDKSRGGYKDLVEEFYDQAVKQNSNLETIEDDIENFYKKREDAIEKYNSFTSYNNRYYADAKAKAATIADATTKQRAGDHINKSETAYRAKMANWQNSIVTLNNNERELRDLHVLLKIMIATPVIEKYQQNNLPDNSKLNEANTDLQKVIEKIKAITK